MCTGIQREQRQTERIQKSKHTCRWIRKQKKEEEEEKHTYILLPTSLPYKRTGMYPQSVVHDG